MSLAAVDRSRYYGGKQRLDSMFITAHAVHHSHRNKTHVSKLVFMGRAGKGGGEGVQVRVAFMRAEERRHYKSARWGGRTRQG